MLALIGIFEIVFTSVSWIFLEYIRSSYIFPKCERWITIVIGKENFWNRTPKYIHQVKCRGERLLGVSLTLCHCFLEFPSNFCNEWPSLTSEQSSRTWKCGGLIGKPQTQTWSLLPLSVVAFHPCQSLVSFQARDFSVVPDMICSHISPFHHHS